MAVIAAEVLIW